MLRTLGLALLPLLIAATPAPSPDAAGAALTDATRAEAVEKIASVIADHYVFPDKGAQMAAAIRKALAAGDYAGIDRERALASRLTQDLRAVTNDKHLAVRFAPAEAGAPDVPHALPAKSQNFAFRKVEVLDGNVGYVRLDNFPDDREARKTADAAMAFVKHVDAIVFDLRFNGGGSPELIRYLSSYFFAEPTLLNTMVDRDGRVVEEYRTGMVKGDKFRSGLPVYVLTSRYTFSGAEEFAYNMKTQKRGTVIGEVTGGGAHPVRGVRANDRFLVAVPYQRAMNPVTHTNWEGIGVEPDVKISADAALDRALTLAKEQRG